MFSPDDTIVAVATPPGRGGLGVVRVSGPDAHGIACQLAGRSAPLVPRHATLCQVAAGDGASDQAILLYFQAPHSYTGEDVVEVSAHGSPVLLRGLVRAAVASGARLAEPGEFTLRAYLRGRLDLVQAEAVRDLVDAVTPAQARAAFDQLEGTLTGRIHAIDADLIELVARLEASLDFPEEGYHFLGADEAGARLTAVADRLDALLDGAALGRLIREGASVAIVGRPNAGKSSLFNQLAGAGRAIVTDRPGTTRDLLTERVDVGGVPMTLVDTAGLRDGADDAAEVEGIARAASARDTAAVVVPVVDGSQPLSSDDERVLEGTVGRVRVVVINKADLPPAWAPEALGLPAVRVSALTGEGVPALRDALVEAAAGGRGPGRDEPALTNVRHIDLVRRAREALRQAASAAAAGTPEEFVLADVHDARRALEEVTGQRTPEDVLRLIFERFCIGK